MFKCSLQLVFILNYVYLFVLGNDNIPMVLVGNKTESDTKREVDINYAKQVATELNCLHIETSARQNVNVDLVFTEILTKLYGIEKTQINPPGGKKKFQRSLSSIRRPLFRRCSLRSQSLGGTSSSQNAKCVIL